MRKQRIAKTLLLCVETCKQLRQAAYELEATQGLLLELAWAIATRGGTDFSQLAEKLAKGGTDDARLQ